jgi:amino acid transporter, AAT family
MSTHINKLRNRHLQMIALGGAIGTGLFFSTAKSIHLTGPSLVLSYLLGGLVLYIIMRAVGEMTVDYPCPGAFSEYANRYIGPYAGFISGWSAWFEYTIVCMVELTASTVFIDYIFPGIPHWILCLVILVLFLMVNLSSIRVFGEFEFWFAGIKIAAIILMVLFTIYLITFDNKLNPQLSTYLEPKIFFAGGLKGFAVSLAIVIFSFGGSEFISIAASETENPDKNVPKAINGVIFRIIIFYVLTIIAIECLYPYQDLSSHISPFVDVFRNIGFKNAALIMNIIAITAALSAFNSCFYASSRILYSLSQNGYAPRYLSKSPNGEVPKSSVLFVSGIILIGVIINYLFPENAIMYLLYVTTAAILIVWFMILLTQLYFRKQRTATDLKYKLKYSPYSNLFAMTILVIVAIAMLDMDEMMRRSICVIPLWIGLLSIIYFFYRKKLLVKSRP